MVLDAALFNTQHYKVRIMDKVEQSSEWSYALSEEVIENAAFRSMLRSPTFYFIHILVKEFQYWKPLLNITE